MLLGPLGGIAVAGDGYDFEKEIPTNPRIQVRNSLYSEVSSVRLGQRYEVIADLGVGTWEDGDVAYVCIKTRPSGRYKCELDRAFNVYRNLYPFGTWVTVGRKHVFGGRMYIQVLDSVTKRPILKRSLIVR